MDEKWVITAKKGDFYGLAERFGLDPVMIRLMVNRGAGTEEKIRQYLYAGVEELYDPRLMKDAVKAAEIIEGAIRRGEKILISSDFDVDGICSGQILYEGIRRLGGSASIKTPHRVLEGYGINRRIVDEAVREDTGLLVTCDNGISAADVLAYAAELGLPVIVTDHHEIPYEDTETGRRYLLPEAAAIVNPHQVDCGYPFENLCGAGVAFKLISLLYERAGIGREALDQLLEYTAIATVADVMELTDENRILVKEGLARLTETRNPGLRMLKKVCGLEDAKITVYHVGFVMGPCFNAAGRLGTTDAAQRLLSTESPEEAERLACELKNLNDSRKEMTEQGTSRAIQLIEASEIRNDRILVLTVPDCHESLAGIIAGRLRERYHKPVIVLVPTEEGYKGSGRSIEAYHMFEGLSGCRDLLVRFGGHAMAAGLSMRAEHVEELRQRLNRTCGLTDEDMKPVVRIDIPVPVQYLNEPLIRQMELLEPNGKGNPKPLFAEKAFRVRSASVIGKNRNVLRLWVISGDGKTMEAILFGRAEEFAAGAIDMYGEKQWQRALRGMENDLRVDLAYCPGINEYMGMTSIQIIIQNYRFKECL